MSRQLLKIVFSHRFVYFFKGLYVMGQSPSKQKEHVKPFFWPIVFDTRYDLHMPVFECFSKFDTRKSTRISESLKADIIGVGSFAVPDMPPDEDLKKVHTEEYLNSLKEKATIASITDISLLRVMPSSFVFDKIMSPFRLQAGGTLLASALAVEYGWAINLGGGQHHCSHDRATPAGFSMFADITMAVQSVREKNAEIKRVLIIDLDVHQGNGYERDFIDDGDVFIFDVYNSEIFPQDEEAKKSIRRKVELKSGIEDEQYLAHISNNIQGVLDESNPQFVLFNAGVDILKGDPLGKLNISRKGVVERDAIVFRAVRSRNIPIVMLLSGGFSKIAAGVVSASIHELHKEGLIAQPKTVETQSEFHEI